MMQFTLTLIVILLLGHLSVVQSTTKKVNVTKPHEVNRTVIPHGCPRGEGVVYRPYFDCHKAITCGGTARSPFNISGCGCGCQEANCTATSFHYKNTTTCPKGFRCLTDGCLATGRKDNVTITCSGKCKPLLK
jgi:hypothetical protein